MESKSIFPQAVKTGLIAIGLSIVLTLLAYVTGMNMFGWVFQVISYAVLLGVMVWGVLSYRKANGGFMSFGQGYGKHRGIHAFLVWQNGTRTYRIADHMEYPRRHNIRHSVQEKPSGRDLKKNNNAHFPSGQN